MPAPIAAPIGSLQRSVREFSLLSAASCAILPPAVKSNCLSILIKQRKDSIEQFTRGGRLDLADKEAAEIKVIEEYLPAAATDEEIEKSVDEAVLETGATSIKDMGKVMKMCMARFSGRPVDGNKVSILVKAKLSN
jgi:uncharacterized protein YqeY